MVNDLLHNIGVSRHPLVAYRIFSTHSCLKHGVHQWKGKYPDQVREGSLLVNWSTCLKPRKRGGLDIKDIDIENGKNTLSRRQDSYMETHLRI
jgi:hypothetical protein